ncbi:FecR family protein [Stenotrophomonas humi]
MLRERWRIASSVWTVFPKDGTMVMNDPSTARRRKIIEDAAEWLVILQDENASDEELQRWAQWMAADREHASAFDSISLLWDAAGGLDSTTPLVETEEAAPSSTRSPSATVVPVATIAVQSGQMQRRRTLQRRWGSWAAIAAGVVVAVGAAQMWLGQKSAAPPAVYAANKGEPRQVTLGDGSRVELDAGSAVSVRFADGRRDIELIRGKAAFSVHHDPDQPFTVQAGVMSGRALGTVFAVDRRADGGASLIVMEGRVRVAGNARTVPVELVAGEEVKYRPDTGLGKPDAVDSAQATGWRSGGAVIYSREPLVNVVADLNRYSRTEIRLADPSLEQLKVTGRWEPAQMGTWLQGMSDALGITMTHTVDSIILERATGKKGVAPGAGH